MNLLKEFMLVDIIKKTGDRDIDIKWRYQFEH